MRIDAAEFAVLDFETTGLFPERHDRVIEVGLVRVDAHGRVKDRYTTLVQPNRDLGPSGLHGIRARDVEGAPVFEEITGDLLMRLEGAVLAAHNVLFDARFLAAELQRIGVVLPSAPRICTLSLGYRVGSPPPHRSLTGACRHFGIELDEPHSALDDANAAAALLTLFLDRARAAGLMHLGDLGCEGEPPNGDAWPRRPTAARTLPRAEALRRPPSSATFLAGLISRLPAASGEASTAERSAPYLSMLDQVLEDRRITREESSSLEILAETCGLTATDAMTAHLQYLRSLATLAMADGRVTDVERRDLDEVAVVLGLGPDAVSESLVLATQGSIPPPRAGANESLAGKSVCFTGALRCRIEGEPVTREIAEKLATAAGLTVQSSVTKKLDLLVVADPETLSGKAKKAREIGTRILADAVFFRMIGAEVE